ncbi:putative serine/threonine protein kinase IREH1 [Cucumis melo var. makuwa]|uniref:Putative serine/threonine protein kinase IREH1 n=1 Tax=Cucumis melo var. makuwa TaxID=1194695 RepID=A0A5D3BIB5_CUCMM|nr:putative serine/threonine protein kinase IREH1 [Cucumis melo var. makuwa]
MCSKADESMFLVSEGIDHCAKLALQLIFATYELSFIIVFNVTLSELCVYLYVRDCTDFEYFLHSAVNTRKAVAMVFKGRFFSSSKKSDSSSPDGSSPRFLGSNSPIRSDKKKNKSAAKDESQISNPSSSSFRGTVLKDASRSKDWKRKDSHAPLPIETPSKSGSISSLNLGPKGKKSADVKDVASSVSPILASSLGLNRIKTRSGPLPQESFLGFKGDKGSLGSSNLSRNCGDGSSGSNSGSTWSGSSRGGKKEAACQKRLGFQDNVKSYIHDASNSENMPIGNAPSTERNPNLLGQPRVQNIESSNEAGIVFWSPILKSLSIL